MMLAYGARGRARARARAAGASSAQLGLLFALFGAVDASLQIARFQRIITEPPAEPSLCASEVLLMLLKNERVSDAIPCAPDEKRRSDDVGVGGTGATPESKLYLACLRSGPQRPGRICMYVYLSSG